jgi:hypothetical protein
MDPERFDRLARALGSRRSRRGVVGVGIGGLLGGLASAQGTGAAGCPCECGCDAYGACKECPVCPDSCPCGCKADGVTCKEICCARSGQDCKTEADCCGQLVCNAGICGEGGGQCIDTGGSCRDESDCCGDLACTDRVCGVAGAVCAHAGDRPAGGRRCCDRLRLEQGRCVIPRGEHCDPKNGRDGFCGRGMICRGGQGSDHNTPTCVPRRRRNGGRLIEAV